MKESKIHKDILYVFFILFLVNCSCWPLWTPKHKTQEEINTAYYCAQRDIRHNRTMDSVQSQLTFKRLLKYMNYPNLKVPTIHVTGTNGKGSVVRKLGASLIEAGYKVGEYTSPGMLTEREDLRLNGKIISQGSYVFYHQLCFRNLIKLFTQGRRLSHLGTNPFFFCMALSYFLDHKVDIIIVEVFMGGKKDHTNVLNPEVSIITNVARDHSRHLSKDTNKILTEKGGIIKKEKPVIFGFQLNRTLAEILAKKSKSPYYFIFPDDMNNFTFDELNAKIARTALELIRPKFSRLEEKHLQVGLKAKLMARLEEIKPERLAFLGELWKLPKLPYKVYNEFKTNFLSIRRILQELRQKYGNMTLRVVLSMSKINEESKSRIEYILSKVDYLHLIETRRSIAVPFKKFNFLKLMKKESSKIDESKFTFTQERWVDGVNSIDLTIEEAFRSSSLREEEEIILIWGVFWSSIKLLNQEYEIDIKPKRIPTYNKCHKLLHLPSVKEYRKHGIIAKRIYI